MPGRNDDFVVLSAPGAPQRPFAQLTVSLERGPRHGELVALSSSGPGRVSFDRTLLLVKPGQPAVVRVFGEGVSSAVDDVLIRARTLQGDVAREDLTVIAGVSLAIEGHFQDRLATDPDPSDHPRGQSGSTRALEGEADLDNVIRFSEPVDLRFACPFEPVRVTRVSATQPRAEFSGGDSLIGERVELGPESAFVDPGNDLSREFIDLFELHLGSLDATGEFPVGGPVDSLSSPEVDALIDAYLERDALLREERARLDEDSLEGRRIDERLALRERYQYDSWQLRYTRAFCGSAEDTSGGQASGSQLLALLKGAAGLEYRIDFYGFEGDCLGGHVRGTLRPTSPEAAPLCAAPRPATARVATGAPPASWRRP